MVKIREGARQHRAGVIFESESDMITGIFNCIFQEESRYDLQTIICIC